VIIEKYFSEKSIAGRLYPKMGKKIFPFFPEFRLLDIDYVDNYPGIFI
jgi:hypothetical protein